VHFWFLFFCLKSNLSIVDYCMIIMEECLCASMLLNLYPMLALGDLMHVINLKSEPFWKLNVSCHFITLNLGIS
jgi:hypothetical protein